MKKLKWGHTLVFGKAYKERTNNASDDDKNSYKMLVLKPTRGHRPKNYMKKDVK